MPHPPQHFVIVVVWALRKLLVPLSVITSFEINDLFTAFTNPEIRKTLESIYDELCTAAKTYAQVSWHVMCACYLDHGHITIMSLFRRIMFRLQNAAIHRPGTFVFSPFKPSPPFPLTSSIFPILSLDW